MHLHPSLSEFFKNKDILLIRECPGAMAGPGLFPDCRILRGGGEWAVR